MRVSTSAIKNIVFFLTITVTLFSFIDLQKKQTLYIIGDSTVKNSSGNGGPGQWGWGTFIGGFFDSVTLTVSNQAMAGRSTRTFTSEGRWDKVMSLLKPGDFVMMQFGHNEGSKPDTNKAGNRGVLRGTGNEIVTLQYADGRTEIVHTYGWYLRKFITDAKSKGAVPVVLSMIPRNVWKEGKAVRASNDFGKWAAEAAKQEGVYFIDLNCITADKYDRMGPDQVKEFFPVDHTHTNEAGARLNAASIVDGLKKIRKCPLNKYLQGLTPGPSLLRKEGS